VLPCVLFLLLGLVARALRWQTLLSGGLSLVRTFHIMNVAYLVNGVLPLRMGEVARMYLAFRAEPPVPVLKSASTIIIERLLDLLAVVMMTLLALTIAPVPTEIQRASAFSAAAALTGFFVLIVLSARRAWAEQGLRWFTQLFPLLRRLPIETWLQHFFEGLAPLTQPRLLLQAIGWTALSWTLSTIGGYFLMFAFFETGSWAATMLYIAAAAFAIALPAVPGNIGTYEASILLALVALGYANNETAVAFAVMVHAVNVLVHVTTGVIGFIQEGISLEQLRSGVREMQTTQETSHG
jgi:hypothetical protein